MENIIVGCISAFIISFYAMPIIIQVAKMKKLYDIPDERKLHKEPIPSLGGLGIYVGFVFALLLNVDIYSIMGQFQFYLACFTVVLIFGLKDDVLILMPLKKLLGQLIVSAILVFKAGLVINNLHGFANITQISHSLSCLLTIITIVVVMNAFNLIDGIDGLAGTIGFITTFVFAVFFYLGGEPFYSMMGFVFCSSIVAFLIFNYTPAKLFMGDTGAMMIGLINSIMVIRFINTAEMHRLLPPLSSPAMGFGILMMPLMDTLRVFTFRILKGKSPFSADRNHLHHMLLDRGLNHPQITATVAACSIVCMVLTYIGLAHGATKLIAAQVIFFFLGAYLLSLTKKRPRAVKL